MLYNKKYPRIIAFACVFILSFVRFERRSCPSLQFKTAFSHRWPPYVDFVSFSIDCGFAKASVQSVRFSENVAERGVVLFGFVRCRERGEHTGVHADADQKPFPRVSAAVRRAVATGTQLDRGQFVSSRPSDGQLYGRRAVRHERKRSVDGGNDTACSWNRRFLAAVYGRTGNPVTGTSVTPSPRLPAERWLFGPKTIRVLNNTIPDGTKTVLGSCHGNFPFCESHNTVDPRFRVNRGIFLFYSRFFLHVTFLGSA